MPLPTPASAATASIVTAVDAAVVDQPLRRLQQRLPVAGSVAALRGRARPSSGQEAGLGHDALTVGAAVRGRTARAASGE